MEQGKARSTGLPLKVTDARAGDKTRSATGIGVQGFHVYSDGHPTLFFFLWRRCVSFAHPGRLELHGQRQLWTLHGGLRPRRGHSPCKVLEWFRVHLGFCFPDRYLTGTRGVTSSSKPLPCKVLQLFGVQLAFYLRDRCLALNLLGYIIFEVSTV